MGKQQSADEFFEVNTENLCLLHLIAMGELPLTATKTDAVRWFWNVREDCTKCMYSENCLCCLYTQRSVENVGI